MKAGISLALSVAANLVFAVPVFAAAVTALLLTRLERATAPAGPATPVASNLQKKVRKRKPTAGFPKHVPNPVYRYLLAPLAAGGLLVFIAAPLAEANATQFYVGSANVAESILA